MYSRPAETGGSDGRGCQVAQRRKAEDIWGDDWLGVVRSTSCPAVHRARPVYLPPECYKGDSVPPVSPIRLRSVEANSVASGRGDPTLVDCLNGRPWFAQTAASLGGQNRH